MALSFGVYVVLFIAATAAIEAFYVCIFVWRYLTTGKKKGHGQRKRKTMPDDRRRDVEAHNEERRNRNGNRPSTLQYPPFWDEHQSAEGGFKVVPLGKTSPEYLEISSEFKRTLPGAEIKRIDRIQNKRLWSKYMECARNCRERNEEGLGEMLLFHGTKHKNPREIYEGNTGFSVDKFGRSGLWGKGTYFAVNASYSDEWAYVMGNTCQVLAANVLTGHSHYSKPDESLNKPPLCPPKRDWPQRRYDCVCGDSVSSRIYVMYDDDKAYPMYLITYARK